MNKTITIPNIDLNLLQGQLDTLVIVAEMCDETTKEDLAGVEELLSEILRLGRLSNDTEI